MKSRIRTAPARHRRVKLEILIVLTISFGMSGIRAVLNLAESLLQDTPLGAQQISLNSSRSDFPLLDLAFQICSAATLFAWAGLALFLLSAENIHPSKFRKSDISWAISLAASIGLPGILLYFGALHFGWTKQIVPGDFVTGDFVEIFGQILWAAANAFGEEIVVVAWLLTRLYGHVPVKEFFHRSNASTEEINTDRATGLNYSMLSALIASAALRASYHLYQGPSAGFGNLVMGIVFGYFFMRTGRIWPLVIAHFLMDTTVFIGLGFFAT